MEQVTQYEFRIAISEERNIAWLEGIVGHYEDVVYDFSKESGYCHVALTVEEPSDVYIVLHNARRQNILQEYRVF